MDYSLVLNSVSLNEKLYKVLILVVMDYSLVLLWEKEYNNFPKS